MGYKAVSFEDILAGLNYATCDKLFLIGSYVVERLRGWPMGGSLSEVGTLIDLQSPINRCYRDDNFRLMCGWGDELPHLRELSFDQIVALWIERLQSIDCQ